MVCLSIFYHASVPLSFARRVCNEFAQLGAYLERCPVIHGFIIDQESVVYL